MQNRVNLLWTALIAALIAGSLGAGWPASSPVVGVPGSPVAESPDFATLELRDPWDMEQYTDVSQYLNESGQRSLVSNPAASDGLFTGQSVGDVTSGNAYFFPLFPGYETAMLIGKVGHRYPIDAGTYHCLYFAMRVDSHAANGFGPDQFRLFWFGDDRLNSGNAQWGGSIGIALYPEAGANAPTQGYRLYRVDLATVQRVAGNTSWNGRATWEGIRIDPTINSGISFAVDWVRLTTCAANGHNFTWTPNNSVKALWLKAAGTGRFIRIAENLNGQSGAASIDLQGVPPGSYTVGVGTNITCCIEQSTSSLVINQTPIVDFVRPSFYSGADYASQFGLPWNFSSAGDIVNSNNMAYTVGGGLMDTTTPSGQYPAGVDAQFFMRLPQPVAPSHYRYLSFRLLTDWKDPWQNTPDGMIVRVVWGVLGVSGIPANRCFLVSQDIPIDIGWNTYWVDFGESFNGTPEESSIIDCPTQLPSWTNSPPILELRIDLNENVSVAANPPGGGGSFHQQVDWMRLTAIDRVDKGTPFPVRLSINRDVSRLTYYYTTNPASPTQTPARPYSSPQASGQFRLLLPYLTQPASPAMAGLPAATHGFIWDTAGVTPNSYYLCVKAEAGGNSGTYCSEAPVIVQ
jgi:hypothetical protein